MIKEEAYLYAKMGREKEAIEALVKNGSNFSETIEFALQLKFSDQSLMWENLTLIASQDNGKVNELMQFIEQIPE